MSNSRRWVGVVIIGIIGISVGVYGFQTWRVNWIYSALSGVAEGIGVDEASPYNELKLGPHPIVLLTEEGTKHEWATQLPANWRTTTLEEVELVGIIGPEQEKEIQECKYEGGEVLVRSQYYKHCELRAAKTGQVIAETTLQGEPPAECGMLEFFQGSVKYRYGSPVSLEQLMDWLEPYIDPNPSLLITTTMAATYSLQMLWNHTYGGPQGEEVMDGIQTTDGGFVFTGFTKSYGAEKSDFWLVKTDSEGNMLWEQTYGGKESDVAFSCVETMDGGFVLIGWTRSFGSGWYDAWLVKTDAQGNMQWDRTYGGGNDEWARAIIETSDGGFVFVGQTEPTGDDEDLWLVKLDNNGVVEWEQTYAGPKHEKALAVIETTDGGYLLTGSDGRLIKTNAQGIEEWTQTYKGWINSIIQTNDGGFAFVSGIKLMKTDSNGVQEWSQTYGNSSTEQIYSIIETSEGNFLLAGLTASHRRAGEALWLVMTDADGELQWMEIFGSWDGEGAVSVFETSEGAFVILGWTSSYGTGDKDAWMFKIG